MTSKDVITACMLLLVALVSCAGNKKNENMDKQVSDNNKILVAYFSATGTTRNAAIRLAEITRGELFEIVPESLYTDADLDWRDTTSRCYIEMHNRNLRPVLADTDVDIEKYELIYLGYPNWWNTAPTIINTFIESHNLNGKHVVPFMTSGGSNITNSEKELHEAYPEIKWRDGLLMNNVTDEDIRNWVEKSSR